MKKFNTEERNKIVLELLTTYHQRLKTPTSSQEVFKGITKLNENGKKNSIPLSETLGLSNSYGTKLLCDAELIEVIGNHENRSKLFKWIGGPPTMETVKHVEDLRKKESKEYSLKLKANKKEKFVSVDATDILNDFIAEHKETYKNYSPHSPKLSNLKDLVSFVATNTQSDYKQKSELFAIVERNSETNEYETVYKLKKTKHDSGFPGCLFKLGLLTENPEKEGYFRYTGNIPATDEDVKRIAFYLNYQKKYIPIATLEIENQVPDETQLSNNDLNTLITEVQALKKELIEEIQKLKTQEIKELEKLQKVIQSLNESALILVDEHNIINK